MQATGINHNYCPAEKTGRFNFDNDKTDISPIGDIRML
jgi:hypothetical protein